MTSSNLPAGKLSSWFIGIFLFFVAIGGFGFAAHGGTEADYTLGLIIGCAGIFGMFQLLKRGFDSH